MFVCFNDWIKPFVKHQRHLVDEWPYFDYDLQIPSHGISKMSYIGYDMKSLKIFLWSRWDHPPSIFEEIDSKEWYAMKSLAKIVKISMKKFSINSYMHRY